MSDELPGEEDLPAGPIGSSGVSATFEQRFASLEESNRLLAADVRTLTATLQVVNDLQLEQAKQRRITDETAAKVAVVEIDTQERIKRTRRASLSIAFGLAILLPLVSTLVYLSLLQHVNDLLQAQKRSSYQSCLIRNQATEENASREEALARLDPAKVTRDLHAESARKLRGSMIDCNRYMTKSGKAVR